MSKQQTAIPRYGNAIEIGASLRDPDAQIDRKIRIFAGA